MDTTFLRTFGELSLRRGGRDGPVLVSASKGLAVLAYLATTPERQAQRSHLSALLWPDRPGNRRRNLRQALYYVRKNAGTELTRTSRDILGLASEHLEVDLWRFEEALAEGRNREVVETWTGPFLDGVQLGGSREFREWIEVEQSRTRAGLLAAHRELVDALLRDGDTGKAVRFARRYAELEPLDEEVQRALMSTLLEAGRHAEAFAAYQRYGARLREAVDEKPDEELAERMRELQHEIFGTPAPSPPSSPDRTGDRSSAAPATQAARIERSWIARGLAALVVAAVALTLLPGLSGLGPGRTDEPDGVAALLRIPDADSSTVATVSGRGLESSVRRPAEQILLSRRGWTPTRVRVSGGYDVRVERRDSDSARHVAAEVDDETAVAWTADGRQLLIWRGRWFGDEQRYRSELLTYDLTTGRRNLLMELDVAESPKASYSPNGTRLALVLPDSGSSHLVAVDADGTHPDTLATGVSPRERPAWSHDGRWIVYGAVADGTHALFRVRADGNGEPLAVTRSTVPLRAVAWLPGGELLYQALGSGESELRLLNPDDGTDRLLEEDLPAEEVLDVRHPQQSWVDQVDLRSRRRWVSPGERFEVKAVVRDVAGEPVPLSRLAFRVHSTDDSVVKVHRSSDIDPQKFEVQVRGSGEATLVASAGGWRSDSVVLVSRALTMRRREILFREQWVAGIDDSRWFMWGEPEPYVTNTSGSADGSSETGATATPERAFVSNGDANFASGATTRQSFPAKEGLTVEWWARTPFTGGHYEDMFALLATDLPRDSPDTWSPGNPEGPAVVAGIKCKSRPGRCHVLFRHRHVVRPPIEGTDRWHRYALQLAPDGTLSWIVDGRLRWQTPPGADGVRPVQDSVHLVVGGRALDREIYHGPVTVYRGTRYGLATKDQTLRVRRESRWTRLSPPQPAPARR